MSRWTDQYNNLRKPDSNWASLLAHANSMDLKDFPQSNYQGEPQRFRKMVLWLEKAFKSLDPDLMPLSSGNIENNINQCVNRTNQANYSSANDSLDQIIRELAPYIFAQGKGAQAAGAAHRNLANEIEDSLAQLTEIQTLYKEIISAEEGNGIENQIEEIKAFYEELTEGVDGEASLQNTINDNHAAIFGKKQEVEEADKKIRITIGELEKYHEKIFGKENEQGEMVGGLKSQLDLKQKKVDVFLNEQEERLQAQEKRIEELLSSATNAGLAAAFNELKKKC